MEILLTTQERSTGNVIVHFKSGKVCIMLGLKSSKVIEIKVTTNGDWYYRVQSDIIGSRPSGEFKDLPLSLDFCRAEVYNGILDEAQNKFKIAAMIGKAILIGAGDLTKIKTSKRLDMIEDNLYSLEIEKEEIEEKDFEQMKTNGILLTNEKNVETHLFVEDIKENDNTYTLLLRWA